MLGVAVHKCVGACEPGESGMCVTHSPRGGGEVAAGLVFDLSPVHGCC